MAASEKLRRRIWGYVQCLLWAVLASPDIPDHARCRAASEVGREPFVGSFGTATISLNSGRLGEGCVHNRIASILLATSTLAHGYWRAGSKLHHFFGAILVAIVAVIVLPISLITRAARGGTARSDTESE